MSQIADSVTGDVVTGQDAGALEARIARAMTISVVIAVVIAAFVARHDRTVTGRRALDFQLSLAAFFGGRDRQLEREDERRTREKPALFAALFCRRRGRFCCLSTKPCFAGGRPRRALRIRAGANV